MHVLEVLAFAIALTVIVMLLFYLLVYIANYFL